MSQTPDQTPIGIKGIKIIADESINTCGNFVAGANKPDKHIRNVNYPRDFQVDILADIATVSPGDCCIQCKDKLEFKNGIEVGHVFKLGTFLSERFNANFLDKDGISRPIYMGCFGIGLGRLMAASVEQNHDSKGIIWPLTIAPYQVHLCALKMEDTKVAETAEKLYQNLTESGIEVLFDDRDESAGIKFNDADLIGIPLRLTISPRTLQNNSIELKWRKEKDSILVPLSELVKQVINLLK